MRHPVRSLILIFLCSGLSFCRAQCPAIRWIVYPRANYLDAHSMILVMGYGAATAFLEEAMHNRLNFFLESGFMKVPLLAEQYHRGVRGMAEILLRPQEDLQSNLRYRLKVSRPGIPDSIALLRDWYVLSHDPNDPEPVLSGNPLLDHMGKKMSCSIKASGRHPLFVQIVLIDPRFTSLHKRYKKFLLPLDGNNVTLNGDSCAAPFQIMPAVSYQAIISVTDLEGHSSLPVNGIKAGDTTKKEN
jgi:hypothetical protein